MKAIITKELAIKAVLMGACSLPAVGSLISSLSTSSLVWAERLATPQEVREHTGLDIPLWVMSSNGSGDGYGSGDGSGYGSGYGYGSSVMKKALELC